MTGLNFWALQYLQLAETGAIQFSVPMLIALLSAWWLGERLDARRWVAIVGWLHRRAAGGAAGQRGLPVPAILLSVANAVLYAAFNMLTAPHGSHRVAGVDATGLGRSVPPWCWRRLRCGTGSGPRGVLTWTVVAMLG